MFGLRKPSVNFALHFSRPNQSSFINEILRSGYYRHSGWSRSQKVKWSEKSLPFSCSEGSAIGFFGSIFGLKSSHCFNTGGITGGFGLASVFVNIALFFVGILLSTLFRIIGLLDFRLALISRLADPDTDLIADGTLDSDGTLADGTVDLWLAAEFWRDFALFALGDCDREGAVDCTCDGAVDLKLVSFSVCCLSRTCPGLKIFLSNFSFGQSVLHHQSKSLFKHN